jgi:glycosyltransferase involved in cell wall biosynthesis
MPIKKTKILFIPNSLGFFGGGERFTMEVAIMLQKDLDITIINPISQTDVKRIDITDIKQKYQGIYTIVDISCRSVHIKKGNFLMMFPTLRGLWHLSESIRKCDVVYEISMNPLILAFARFYAMLYQKRFILDIGNPYLLKENQIGKAKLLQSILFQFIGELHIQTRSQQRTLKEYNYTGITYYVPHPIWSKKELIQTQPKNPLKGFVCLFVGRLDQSQKGIDLLVKIINETLSKTKKISFEIIGSGSANSLLVPLAICYQNNVRLRGFVSDAELEWHYNNANLFISTSRFESPGINILEAQAHGLSVLAWYVTGPKDIIQNSIQGQLVNPFDTQAFAKTIIKESKHTSSSRKKAKIKAIIKEQYSTERFKKKFNQMIRGRS